MSGHTDVDRLFDRFSGCLLGFAVGDALGTTIEFRSPGTFEPVTSIVGGGPFGLQPGEWTDDTSMALCLAASLVETRDFDPVDQAQRYVRWRDDGYMSSTGHCFDIGNTVSTALRRFESCGEAFSGPTDERSAGNGSIMRLAPVPMRYFQHPSRAVELSAESSRTTHGTQMAIDACRYLGGLLVGSIRGDSKEELLSGEYGPVPGCWQSAPLHSRIRDVALGSFKEKSPPAIRGTGFVVASLEAALWAFYSTTSFRDALLAAVNLGDDADTTGAVCGQIAGAYHGASSIPSEWMQTLAKHDLLDEAIEGLWELSRS